MAAKAKASAKAHTKPAGRKKASAKAKPSGVQLNAAQLKMWNAASTATRNKLALLAAARGLRQSRLSAAYGMRKKYSATRSAAQAAAIAANATRMSFAQARIGHQNAALLARIERNMANHVSTAQRLQFAQAGEKAWTHNAVMRTLTQSQAVTAAAKNFRAINRKAIKAAKSTRKTTNKKNPVVVSKSLAGVLNPAGLKAAKSVKVPVSGRKPGRPKGAAGKAKQAAVSQRRAAAQSRKAPVKKAKGRTAPPPWLGDEETPNCVVTAIANHLLYARGITVSDKALRELTETCGPEPTIEEVLWHAWLSGWPGEGRSVRLGDYFKVEGDAIQASGLVVGFESENGPHAALSRDDGKVISWGSEIDREAPIEEAWELQWRVVSPLF